MGRFDLTDKEWKAIEPHLPNKTRGVERVDDRRVLNGIFWVPRSGARWSDLPERYGPVTTIYNRFQRWRKAGIWDRLMDAIVAAYDGQVQMIDSSVVRVHQHGAAAKSRQDVIWNIERTNIDICATLCPTDTWNEAPCRSGSARRFRLPRLIPVHAGGTPAAFLSRPARPGCEPGMGREKEGSGQVGSPSTGGEGFSLSACPGVRSGPFGLAYGAS